MSLNVTGPKKINPSVSRDVFAVTGLCFFGYFKVVYRVSKLIYLNLARLMIQGINCTSKDFIVNRKQTDKKTYPLSRIILVSR